MSFLTTQWEHRESTDQFHGERIGGSPPGRCIMPLRFLWYQSHCFTLDLVVEMLNTSLSIRDPNYISSNSNSEKIKYSMSTLNPLILCIYCGDGMNWKGARLPTGALVESCWTVKHPECTRFGTKAIKTLRLNIKRMMLTPWQMFSFQMDHLFKRTI